MTPREGTVKQVVVSRLLCVYDPWEALGEDRAELTRKVRKCRDPLADYVAASHRDENYNVRRIRYFLDEIMKGWVPDPIDVDTHWTGMSPDGVVIDDGHHRVIAAYMAKTKTLPAYVGGWCDVIEWLTGARWRNPLR